MRRTRVIGLALVAALAVSAIGATSASAKTPAGGILFLTREFGNVIIPVNSEQNIEQYYRASAATVIFRAKGKLLRCEKEEPGFSFRHGHVLSTEEPRDTLRIYPEIEPSCATPVTMAGEKPEVRAILLDETLRPWLVAASSTGKAEARTETGNIQLVLLVEEGTRELTCHVETSALNGSNNATASEEPLTISFTAAKNRLLLNKATSTKGCPTSVKLGFDVAPVDYENAGEDPRIHEHIQPANPAFSIEKLQEIAGSGAGFTKSKLSAKVGETIDYEIVIINTGNEPLHFSALSDEHCEAITGGPGSGTYHCKHTLTAQDLVAGSYSNSASDTGTPPTGGGSPVTHTSNTVVVEVQSH